MPGVVIVTMKHRRDFVAAAGKRRTARPGVVVQARRRVDDGQHVRIGYTASKKVGGAVLRNRAKRRLRAAAAAVMPELGEPGWDYVLIARRGATVARRFVKLTEDLTQAVHTLHARRKR